MVIEYRDGVVMDAISIMKYHEMGDPSDPFYPEGGWKGMPAIRIERDKGDDICLLFKTKEDRNKEYDYMRNQITWQNTRAQMKK